MGILCLVVLASVALFHWKMNLPFVDALYFVVTIITTVGFGDYNFQNASPFLKLYGVMLMLCGAAILATLFSIITDLVLSTRFRDVLARGCSRLQDHIIEAGSVPQYRIFSVDVAPVCPNPPHMARKLRVEYPGAIYHVMNRGDRREPIFADDFDRRRFLETLADACDKTSWQVQAWCQSAWQTA